MGFSGTVFSAVDLFSKAVQRDSTISLSIPPLREVPALTVSDLALVLCAGEQLRTTGTGQLQAFVGVLERAESLQVLGVPEAPQLLREFWQRYARVFRSLLISSQGEHLSTAFLSLSRRSLASVHPCPLWTVLKTVLKVPVPAHIAQAALDTQWEVSAPEGRPATMLLTALLRAVPHSTPLVETLFELHMKKVTEGSGTWWQVAFLFVAAACRGESASEWLKSLLQSVTPKGPKMGMALADGIQYFIERSIALEAVPTVLSQVCAWVSTAHYSFELFAGVFSAVCESPAAATFDPRSLYPLIAQGENTAHFLSVLLQKYTIAALIPQTVSTAALQVICRLHSASADASAGLFAALREHFQTLVDSSSEGSCHSLLEACVAVSSFPLATALHCFAIREFLWDFERRSSLKQVDAKKGSALAARVAKDVWGICARPNADTEWVTLLPAACFFKQTYKAEMGGIAAIIGEGVIALDGMCLADFLRIWESEGLYSDEKLATRCLKQTRKVLEDLGISRKLLQSSSLLEQLLALLCSEWLRGASPLLTLMKLLRDNSLQQRARDVVREAALSSAKKVGTAMRDGATTLSLILSLSDDAVSESVAREALGFAELNSKATRVFRCEEPLLDQVPSSDLALLETAVSEFARLRESPNADLAATALCELAWRGKILHSARFEKMIALLCLKLRSRAELPYCLQYLDNCSVWLESTDYKKAFAAGTSTLNQWMKKKGRPAIITAIKGPKRAAESTPFARIILAAQPGTQLYDAAETLRVLIWERPADRALVQHFFAQVPNLQSRLALELCALGLATAALEETFAARLLEMWRDALDQLHTEYTNTAPNHLLFVLDSFSAWRSSQTTPVPPLLPEFMDFLEESLKESEALRCCVLLPLQGNTRLPGQYLFRLVNCALRSQWEVPLCVLRLLEFYEQTSVLGSLEVAPCVITETLKLVGAQTRLQGEVKLNARNAVELPAALNILQVLVAEDVQMLAFDVKETQSFVQNPEQLFTTAWKLSPRLGIRLWRQCAYAVKYQSSAIQSLLRRLASEEPVFDHCVFDLEAVEVNLCFVDPPSIPMLLLMLGQESHCTFAARHLRKVAPKAWIFYLPQMIQLAVKAHSNEAVQLLREIVREQPIVKQRASWLLQTLEPREASELTAQLDLDATPCDSLFHKLAAISLSLTPKDPANPFILRAKTDLSTESAELPLDPTLSVVGIDPEASRPLRSAKRVPVFVEFQCKRENSAEVQRVPAIVKINDDTRSDQLTMQFIELALSVFESHQTPCYLRPYQILPLNLQQAAESFLGCLMEVVPGCRSRDELFSEGFETIASFLQALPGDAAVLRQNFVKSMAGYSLVCYLLQIKDRHNGNLLLTREGHIVHIDFGFILALSPGGNAGVENVEFKLTKEMADAMGGLEDFKRLFMQSFLVLREYYRELVALFELMKESGCVCFTPGAVSELSARFFPSKPRVKVAEHLVQMVYWAYDSMYTRMYDNMQKASQNIQC